MTYDSGSSSNIAWRVVRLVVPWIGLALVIGAIWSFMGDYNGAQSPSEATSTADASGTVTPAAGAYVRVITQGLNLRAEPSTSGAVVTVLNAEQQLSFIEEKSGWYHVRTTDGGAEGWVAAGGQYSELVQP